MEGKSAYPANEIAEYVENVSKGDIDVLAEEYYNRYEILLEGRIPEEFKGYAAAQAELVFISKKGHGIAASSVDLGDRFRWIINDAECKKVESPNAEATGWNRILDPATRLCQRYRSMDSRRRRRSYRIFL